MKIQRQNFFKNGSRVVLYQTYVAPIEVKGKVQKYFPDFKLYCCKINIVENLYITVGHIMGYTYVSVNSRIFVDKRQKFFEYFVSYLPTRIIVKPASG